MQTCSGSSPQCKRADWSGTGAKNSSEGAREKMLHDELRALKDCVAERESATSQLQTRIADLEKAEPSHSCEVHALKGKYGSMQLDPCNTLLGRIHVIQINRPRRRTSATAPSGWHCSTCIAIIVY